MSQIVRSLTIIREGETLSPPVAATVLTDHSWMLASRFLFQVMIVQTP
jgi:hypothetical protein